MARPREASRGAGGLVLISSTALSGVSSASFDNVFSSKYDNYMVKFVGQGNTTTDIHIRFRVGGVDNSSNNYFTSGNRYGSNGTYYQQATNPSTVGHIFATGVDTGTLNSTSYISNPYSSNSHKSWHSIYSTWFNNVNTSAIAVVGGVLMQSAVFDGFTLTTNSANQFTGTIKIYGIRN